MLAKQNMHQLKKSDCGLMRLFVVQTLKGEEFSPVRA